MPRPIEFDPEVALTAAMDLFWCKGYEGSSLSALLDVMQIGRASFYNTFGSKEQLFLRALQRYIHAHDSWIVDTLSEPTEPLSGIQAVFDAEIRKVLQDPQHRGCFIINSAIELAPYNPQVETLVYESIKASEQAFQDALERAEADGTIYPGRDLQALARFLMNAVRGIRVMGRQQTSRDTLDDIVNITLSVLT